jgi:hypothetical protein
MRTWCAAALTILVAGAMAPQPATAQEAGEILAVCSD